jgi:phenylacetate-CoA ligase
VCRAGPDEIGSSGLSTTGQRIYRRLPSSGQTIAASLRGLYLKSWRYGPETERLVEEAIEREEWSAERWRSWREERLAFVLHRAATQVPYYRQHWLERRRGGDKSSSELIENWPILEKESVRANPRAFVADDCNVRQMFHEHTSGTSGTSLDLWWSKSTVRAWYALFEARWRRWYGVSRQDRWANIGGQLVTAVNQRRPPFWVWNSGLNQLYMSSYHLAPDLISHYLKALSQYRVTYLLGYPSSLFALAQEALRLGASDLKIKVAITNAEPLYDYQREAISKAFQCPVYETYGMAEIVAAASECQQSELHLWPEVGSVEIVQANDSVPLNGSGELILTGLLNSDMPLIRYRIGDRGAFSPTTAACACGRTLPRLASIDGRSDDVIYTEDGRAIGRLDPIFKAHLPIREAQIIQEAPNRIRVRYVPTREYNAAAGQSIVRRLKDRLGEVNISLEAVNEIPRGANGKFRAVVGMNAGGDSLLPKATTL